MLSECWLAFDRFLLTTNLQEYLRGTDPNVADPVIALYEDIPMMPPWAMATLAGVLVTAGLGRHRKR